MSKTYFQVAIQELIDEELTRQSIHDDPPVSKEAREHWDIINHFMLEMMELATRCDTSVSKSDDIIFNDEVARSFETGDPIGLPVPN